MNAITEWAALPATEMFLRDNAGDSDFCAFMSIWFFEEQKHSLALQEYLRRFRPIFATCDAPSSATATHPTNLHVNKRLFPNDTVQSRLPDPHWLERWLDEQIHFDGEWEARVSRMILKNLSSLFGYAVETVPALNRLRKTFAAAV
jgi:hypothetical protein